MKLLLTILSLLNGGFMLLDGVHVMLKGKYIGPEKPGPWRFLFEKMGIDVFRLGPLFVIYGICWLAWVVMLWKYPQHAFLPGLLVSALTLWYLPVGTLISLAVLIVLLAARSKPGI